MTMLRAILHHLRFHYSWLMLPLWLLTVCISPNFGAERLGLTVLLLHFLLYPATNGFSGYFSEKYGSTSSSVHRYLLLIAMVLAALAIWLAMKISLVFAAMVLGYTLAMVAYDHPRLPFQRHPVVGLAYRSIVQGVYLLGMIYVGLNDYPITAVFREKVLSAGGRSSLMMLAVLLLISACRQTADEASNEIPRRLSLGIRQTFRLASVLFVIAALGWVEFLGNWLQPVPVIELVLALAPALLYFIWWHWKVRTDEGAAGSRRLALFIFLLATGMNVFFFRAFLLVSNVAQVFV
ncbi:MAG: hypothetical protein ACKORJ_03190 [Bacteroidota bacterium]